MRLLIVVFISLCAPISAFSQTTAPSVSSLSQARSIVKSLVVELDAAKTQSQWLLENNKTQKELTTQALATNAETAKAVTKLHDELMKSIVNEKKARVEAHENAKQRDIFLGLISIVCAYFAFMLVQKLMPLLMFTGWVAILVQVAAPVAGLVGGYWLARLIVSLIANALP